MFALYGPGYGYAIARGGRYDGIGEQFGNARPATGFDVNLKTLLGMATNQAATSTVWVPFDLVSSVELDVAAQVEQLRTRGLRVVQALSAADEAPEICGHVLGYDNGWRLEPPLENIENGND